MKTNTESLAGIGVLAPTLILAAATANSADVGYYDLVTGQGEAYQVAPITAVGETPVQMTTLSPQELGSVDVLFALNPSNFEYGSEYVGALGDLAAAIDAGLILCFAGDRRVTEAAANVPGAGTISFVRDVNFTPNFDPSENIDVLDDTTLVTTGAAGAITDTNLDGGNLSNHGHATTGSLPAGSTAILSDGTASHAVTFSYPHGNGAVVYSTVPTDFYLKGSGVNPPADTFRNVYAPNTIEYCVDLVNQTVEVPVEDCTAGGEGCPIAANQEGEPATILEFPAGFEPPTGEEFTATRFEFVDPRVDENGICKQEPLEIEVDGEIARYPEWLCGNPNFFPIVTDAGFDIQDGTISIEMFPDAFTGESASTCDNPIPMGVDLQDQDVVVWQGDGEVAQELTDSCGSSRGRSRGKSIFTVGMNINFGIDYTTTPEAVEQAFINLTIMKLEDFVDAVKLAKPAFKRRFQFFLLRATSRIALELSRRGRHKGSLLFQKIALKQIERAKLDTTLEFNHFGNLRSRVGNTIFMTKVKVIPFLP